MRPGREALLAALALLLPGCLRPRQPTDVVLVTIDTLRPDHLGAYGYASGTSPSLDALAGGATLFENAVAQAPHTIPSMLQIMTSRYAGSLEIAAADRTLAEELQARGYQTFAVLDNPHFEQDPKAHGLTRGFERFYRNGVLSRDSLAQQLYKTNTSADTVTAQALRVLRARQPGRPFFLWVHYMDPHDPYLPPFDDDMDRLSQLNPSPYNGDVRASPLYKNSTAALSDADREHLVELYDAEIRYVDRSLGDLLAYLAREHLLGPALLVLASDHGESLGDHGIWTHGQSCYDPEIRIPLIVKEPQQRRPERRREAVEAIDIFPTVMEVLGLPTDALRLEGLSLRRPHSRPAFVFWQNWQVVRTPEWKLVQRGEAVQLYRIDDDREERQDVLASHPDVAHGLLAARRERLAGLGRSAAELERESSAVVERLKALGYLGH